MSKPRIRDNDYLSFYQRVYGAYVVEKRLVDGKDTIGMFIAQQPEGYFPDDPLPSYNLQMNMGSEIFAGVDLGAGKHEMKMQRGGFVVSPPDTPTTYEVYNQHRIMCLGIPPSYFTNAAEDLGIDVNAFDAMLTDTHKDPIVRQIVKECWGETNNEGIRGALFVDANLMTLSTRLLTLALGKNRKPPKTNEQLGDAQFDRVCQYVDSNIDTSLRMKTLASLTGLTEHGFSRAFKARTDQSPYQWVIERRLARAEQLLRHSRMSLAEIAYAVGFSSQSHMTTLFSQKTGVTPAELRKELG